MPDFGREIGKGLLSSHFDYNVLLNGFGKEQKSQIMEYCLIGDQISEVK